MAGILENPPVLQQPFAYNGDKNTIPLDATGDQRASLQEGFPTITSTPITQGGIPPERKDFNGLGNLLSSLYFYLQNGGQFTFNQDVSDAIGGYPQGAILNYVDSSNNISYKVRSLINNNTFNFVSEPSYIDGVKWTRVYSDDLSPYQLKSNLSQALDTSTEKYPSNKVVLDSINGRANLALSNVSSEGKIVISTQGKPSARYDDLTLGPNGTIYTAIANGWFSYQGDFTANNGAFFENISTGFCSGSCRSSSTGTAPMGGSIPVRKGEQVTLYYAGFTKNMFRFYYDEGMK